MIHPNDFGPSDDEPPRWWRAVVFVAAIVAGVLTVNALTGCAKIQPRPAQMAQSYDTCVTVVGDAHVGPATAVARYRDARDNVMVVLAQALASQGSRSEMAQELDACAGPIASHEATNTAIVRSNADIAGAVADALKLPASIMAGGWAAERLLSNAGSSNTSVSGTNNTTGGRDAASFKRMDVSSTISAGDNSGDEAVTLPAE